ncbi:MAG TPA: hypothetical protein VN033_10175 [Vulgatibacter sp.]|nr:hypothetical protein [Vulgatibacter sp.]
MTAAWWLARSMEMRRLASAWVQRAYSDVWIYQQTVEKFTYMGEFPIAFPVSGSSQCVNRAFTEHWTMDAWHLDSLLHCIRGEFLRQSFIEPTPMAFEVKDLVDSLTWRVFTGGFSLEAGYHRIPVTIGMYDLERRYGAELNQMVGSVVLDILYELSPGEKHVDPVSDALIARLRAGPTSFVRLNHRRGLDPSFRPLDEVEWMSGDNPNAFPVRAKVDENAIGGGVARSLDLRPIQTAEPSYIRLTHTVPTSEGDFGKGLFSPFGIARDWVIEIDDRALRAKGYNIENVRDIRLIFEGGRSLPDSHFGDVVREELLGDDEGGRVVFAAGSPDPSGDVSIDLGQGDPRHSIQRVVVFLIQTGGSVVSTPSVEIEFASGTVHARPLVDYGDDKVVAEFVYQPGLPMGDMFGSVLRARIVGYDPSSIDNVVFVVEYR